MEKWRVLHILRKPPLSFSMRVAASNILLTDDMSLIMSVSNAQMPPQFPLSVSALEWSDSEECPVSPDIVLSASPRAELSYLGSLL